MTPRETLRQARLDYYLTRLLALLGLLALLALLGLL